MTGRDDGADPAGYGGGSGRAGITESVDSLIAHMNASRRLYMVLVAAALVMGPVSAVFAAFVLLPGIATEVGPDYELSVELDINTDDIGDYYGLPADHIIGAYSGSFAGKMLGHHTDEEGNLITGAGRMDGERGFFYGEFVGEFDGEFAVLTGEVIGEFTGELHSIVDEGSTPGIDVDDHLYYASIGVYEGRFDGDFAGMFFGAANRTALEGVVDGGDFVEHLAAGGGGEDGDSEWAYSVSYVPGEEIEAGAAADEYEPRFAAYGVDGDGVHRHTDITAAVTALVAAVVGASAVVMYVGVREARFYRRWGERFERYVRAREAAERELGGGQEGGNGEGAAGGQEGGEGEGAAGGRPRQE